MRTRMSIIAALGLALATVSCGDDGTTTTTPTTSVTVTTMSVAELEANLLTVGDLPAGWQLGEPVNEMDFADSMQIPCDDTAINPTIAQRLTPVAGVQFAPSDGSSMHMIELATPGEPDQLTADLNVFIEAFRACAAMETPVTAPAEMVITEMTLPTLGDPQAAFAIYATEGTTESGTPVVWYVRIAVVQVGGVIVSIGLTEIVDSMDAAPTTTDEQFVDIVTAAVEPFAA